MLISTFLIIRRLPDYFQSSASVVVSGEQQDRQAVSARVATITERIDSRSFLESLIKRHNLYPEEMRNDGVEAAIARMRKDIKIDTKYRGDDPETLTIVYRYSDPATAKNVATEMISAFGRMNDAVEQQVTDESGKVASEISEIETRLDQLGQQRAVAAARSRAAARIQSVSSEIRAQRIAARSSSEELSNKQYALQQQIAQQKQQIEDQEKIVKSAPTDTHAGGSYGVLLVRKAEINAQLKEYATQYTDQNPKVIQARTQLAEVNRQIEQLNASSQQGAPVSSPEARELRAMQRELARMQTELEVTRRELENKKQTLDSTPAVSAVSVPVASTGPAIANISTENDVERLRDRYNALLRKQESLQNMQVAAAGLDPGVFQIVDLPAESQMASGPNRTRLILVALALALVVGLAVAAAVEFPHLLRIHDDRDTQYYLGAPVIALIPETLTPVEQGRTRRLAFTRTLGLFLLSAALVPLLVFLLGHLKIFQALAIRW